MYGSTVQLVQVAPGSRRRDGRFSHHYTLTHASLRRGAETIEPFRSNATRTPLTSNYLVDVLFSRFYILHLMLSTKDVAKVVMRHNFTPPIAESQPLLLHRLVVAKAEAPDGTSRLRRHVSCGVLKSCLFARMI